MSLSLATGALWAGDPFLRALLIGAAVGVGLVAVFAVYAWLAPRVRNYAAYRKTRRLHTQVERQRRGEGSR